MKKYCSNLLYPLLIIFLVGFLAFKNYVPGTFLSGWDTLHPEFNFHLYLNRILSGVWQEHQGVGAVAAQSHAAELTRITFPYFLSLVLPINLVRYAFIFLTLAIGGIGLYYHAKYILSISLEKSVKPAAFLASIFYILNLATIQQYYDPLEMFTVHFATLPWLFFLAIKYLREGKKKNIIWFSVVTILSSSISHTATLFYVYFGLFSLYVLTVALLTKSKGRFKRGGFLVGLTLILNLFWLGPNVYYVTKESQTVSNSQISKTFLTEAFLQSRAFGDSQNLALLKNFPFNWREFDFSENAFVDQMAPWISHLGKPYIKEIGYVFMGLSLLGIVVALFRKQKYALSFLPILAVCVIFWINENPPFTVVFAYLRQNIPLFAEALRFPFTKFSILLITCLSVFLAFSSHFVLRIFAKIKLQFLVVPAILACFIYYTLPAFNGYFIDPAMKVDIPNEYFQVFSWFEKQDSNARVAKFPIQSFWNWVYYSWGYQGAGFTWFGIPQATMDREFDRWGLYNEDFYYQASNALYSGNSQALYNVFDKYQIKYFLLDESVINAGGNSKILYTEELKKMIAEYPDSIHEVAKFNFLTVYETKFGDYDKYVWAPSEYKEINTDMTYAKVDPLYATYGDYIEDGNISFPFVNMDKRGDIKIFVVESNPATSSAKLTIENIETNDKVDLNISNTIKTSLESGNGFETAHNCDIKGIGSVYRDYVTDGVLYRAEDGGVSCDYANYPDLKYSQAYILHIVGENKEGRSLKIYLINYQTERADLEELLPEGKFDETYFIYPSVLDGSGYTLDFETRSYGKIASENLISTVEFYPVDYAYLANYKTSGSKIILEESVSNEIGRIQNNLQIKSVKKYVTWGYSVETEGAGLMALGQGYERGWIAVGVQGSKFKVLDHKMVNSWANGWIVDNNQSWSKLVGVGTNGKADQLQPVSTIYLFFWPQALEWGGMAAGVITLIFILVKNSRS